jgi:ubiquinone/menaquinone biosynthesis C-methylase UbiE
MTEKDGEVPSCRGRVSLIAGDFFESIPSDGDIYVMKQVLHDWDDPRALAILKNCRRVMKTGAKLLVAELIIPEAGPAALLGRSLISICWLSTVDENAPSKNSETSCALQDTRCSAL